MKDFSTIDGDEGILLLVVDVQEKLLNVIPEKQKVLTSIIRLIKFANHTDIDILLTEQYPKGLGRTIETIKKLIAREPFAKTTFSAIGAEGLMTKIEELGINNIIVCGIEAHICVQQTVIDLTNRGYRVYIPIDSISSRNNQDKSVAINRMEHAGGIISTTESVIYEFIKDSKHPCFKEIVKLIK
ncbi:isochorismatase family protein [Prochlorococcus sp. MIT 1300]|uniref:isochorismatase family protein n=1 Tax=Prochlorococcus sp. MIT 1300 TaxID=3096218 RepID=UPI002A75ACB6|nr:isochorismatase family protein [Prochlorococcus sp. MIT 1300]